MSLRFLMIVVAFAALALPARARAAWLQATTRHFVLYADTNERDLRAQALALEQLDYGMRRFLTAPDPPEAASNKLTVFSVRAGDMRTLCDCADIAGFYVARVSGSVVFSTRGEGDAFSGRTVLLHEYGHHFLLGSYEIAFPAWYSEGFAEFVSTMTATNGAITLGNAANHRAWGIMTRNGMTAEALFDPYAKKRLTPEQIQSLYGRGWLLTHYVMFDAVRRPQFQTYLRLINSGKPSVAAAREAFGDLNALEKDLNAYLARTRIPGARFPATDMATPEIRVRALGAGEAALVRLRTESVRGVSGKTAPTLYRKAAPIAARFPEDAVAQGWFAEMAFDAGEDAVAEAAADRAIAIDPKSVQGLLYKARVRLRALAKRGDATDAEWTAARATIVRANRVDPDDAEPLWIFYLSFAQAAQKPAKSAIVGLYRAQELVPQDPQVRYMAARQRLLDGEPGEAKRLLRPLAYNPHGSGETPATRMLAALDAGKAGQAVIDAAAEPVASPAKTE